MHGKQGLEYDFCNPNLAAKAQQSKLVAFLCVIQITCFLTKIQMTTKVQPRLDSVPVVAKAKPEGGSEREISIFRIALESENATPPPPQPTGLLTPKNRYEPPHGHNVNRRATLVHEMESGVFGEELLVGCVY
ncbi:hypothetical protein JTE90_013684 [Oedothorax gibbosus]|uniref:Uncharacterized protein n=1 Tax=Oedothorax gibbosus TaxID=931172 RepID=A0AAV6VB53_9ARAC|nr:hypothetical protein JTE90_013684 [Oedothorax gibbosus]